MFQELVKTNNDLLGMLAYEKIKAKKNDTK